MPCTSIEKSALKGAGYDGFQSFVPSRHFSSSTSSVVASLQCSHARVWGTYPVAHSCTMAPSEKTSAMGVMPICRKMSGDAYEWVPRIVWVLWGVLAT